MRFWYVEFYRYGGHQAEWWRKCETLSEACTLVREVKGRGIPRVIAPRDESPAEQHELLKALSLPPGSTLDHEEADRPAWEGYISA